MFPKIGQFKKSKPDNWKPGTFSGKTSWGTNPNAAVVGPSPSPKKSTYSPGGAPDKTPLQRGNQGKPIASGAAGTAGSPAPYTSNPGYDLMH